MENLEYLENKVLAMPGIQPNSPTPRLLSLFLEEISPRLRLLPSVRELLEFIDNRDIRVSKTKYALESFPDDSQKFVEYIQKLRKSDEQEAIDSLDQAIAVYGLDNSRNLTLCFDFYTNITGKPFPWDKNTGYPGLDPKNVLKFANRCYDIFEDSNRYPHRAFAAGLIYDGLRLFAEVTITEKKTVVTDYIEKVLREGQTTAHVLLSLSKEMKKMELGEFVVAAALLNGVGKAAIAILDPGYIKFADVMERENLSRPLVSFAERRRYGISHSMLGYLICGTFSSFRPIAQAILYSGEPYIAKLKNQTTSYELASSLYLSANIVRTQMDIPGEKVVQSKFAAEIDTDQKVKSRNYAVQKHWLGAAIDKHELPPQKIYEIVSKLREALR